MDIKKYKKKNGKTAYMFKAYLGIDETTGKKIETSRRGFKTEKEARIALNKLLIEFEESGTLKKQSHETFEDLSIIWFESYQHTVKASSLSRTRIIFDKHILPAMGKMKMNKITTLFLQQTINDWHKHGSSKQYPLFMNYIKKVFQLAITMGIVEHNPAVNVVIPKKTKTNKDKPNFYTRDQLQQFLTIIQKESNPYMAIRDYTLFRLLAFSGCRIGEILALTWSDIDFKENKICISKTVTKSKEYYISESPKTSKSNRVLPIDLQTMNQLKKWKLEQSKFLLRLGHNQANYVFTNEFNQFTVNQAVTERLKIYQERVGLHKIGLHGFRHTHASLLFEAGASIKEVSERLGHANINTTMNVYTHLTDHQKEQTVEKFIQHVNF